MEDSNVCTEEVNTRVRENVRNFVKSLSYLNYPIGEPSLVSMNELIEGCSPFPELVEEELLKLIFHQDELNEDLTIKYYAKKVLVHFRTCRLEKKWHSFLTSPTYKESLLEGALLVSQWGQVEHEQKKSLSEIEDIIDNISKRVRQLVDAKNSTGEAYSVLKTVRITLDCIKTVLYDEMGFTEMDKDDISNFDNVYVDKVLQTKRGHWLVLLVIYHEIAKRLGILCLPVTADSKYIILKHRAMSKNGTVDVYINPSKGNAWKGLPVSESSPFRVVPANIFFIQLVKYLAPCRVLHFHLRPIASILNKKNHLHFTRLACMITSRKVSAIEGYAKSCNNFGYQLEQAMELLKSLDEYHDHNCLIKCIQNLSEQQALIANREIFGRLPWTKYAAGLVMIYNHQEDFLEEKVYVNSDTTDTAKYQHNASLPSQLCVIFSTQCNCRFCNRTGYRVLFDNGNLVCVREEHLKLHPEGAVINNPHIGIFFERFDGRRYIPNTELMTQFPEDDAFAKSLMG